MEKEKIIIIGYMCDVEADLNVRQAVGSTTWDFYQDDQPISGTLSNEDSWALDAHYNTLVKAESVGTTLAAIKGIIEIFDEDKMLQFCVRIPTNKDLSDLGIDEDDEEKSYGKYILIGAIIAAVLYGSHHFHLHLTSVFGDILWR